MEHSVSVNDRPQKSAFIKEGVFGEELVIFHAMSKQYVVLSATAAQIWQLCDGARSVNAIVKAIESNVSSGESVAADVCATIAGLRDFGFLEKKADVSKP